VAARQGVLQVRAIPLGPEAQQNPSGPVISDSYHGLGMI
jgi:hypothetical protein